MSAKRTYRQQRRAENVNETRRRITEAAVELHGTLGPARTTVSAIAERAGVERLTVYRHFPDEEALFQACSSHWAAQHPVPDPAAWAGIDDPPVRLERALSTLYGYYRGGRAMLENVLRDAPSVAAVRGPVAQWRAYFEAVRALLRQGWSAPDGERLDALLGHVLDFRTWTSLADQGLGDEEAAELMVSLVDLSQGGQGSQGSRRSLRQR